MSKSHVRELSNVYKNIFADALYAFPTLGDEFERDLSRLLRLSEQRGIHVFVVDLPAIGKHFDKCLSTGQYVPPHLPMTKAYGSVAVIPKFLRGLYLLIFEESGCLKEDYSAEAIIFVRQILFAAKKAELQCSEGKVRNEVAEFALVDRNLPEPEGFWSEPSTTVDRVLETYQGFGKSLLYKDRLECMDKGANLLHSVFLRNLDLVSGLINSSLGSYSHEDWRFRHGPGAISETTKIVNKYCWRNWSERLENAFPIADCGYHNYGAWVASLINGPDVGSVDPSSRLIDVPKTYLKPRLIAAEPSEHQWCQQNIWHYFCSRVQRTWISKFVRFRDQTRNQELCTRGSVDGSLATVDLSAASDRVTCHAVGQLFRGNPRLLIALQASRTRFVGQKIDLLSPSVIGLRKFSTMGSACTFPVETLMFLAISLAAILTTRKLEVNATNIIDLEDEVAVFGDDIIVPSDSRSLLVTGLEILDFKVNVAKSHWTGKFRESCGVDSYAGVNVTPAYWKKPCNSRKPESVVSTIAVANNFQMKYMLCTSQYLASTLQTGYKIPFVAMDSGVCGLRTFCRPLLSSYRTRWNSFLQRVEAWCPTFISRAAKTPITDDSALLQYFTEDPAPYQPWKGGVPQRPKLNMRLRWVASQDLEAQPDLGGEIR